MTPRRITLAADRDPWERQPGESERQYARFAMYRDLGRARTLTQAAEMLTIGGRVTYGQLRNIASSHRWTERAQAWDREADRVFCERIAEQRQRLIETEARIATTGLREVADRLRRITPAEMDDLGPLAVARLGDLFLKWLHHAYDTPLPPLHQTPPATSASVDIAADLSEEELIAELRELRDEINRQLAAYDENLSLDSH